MKPISPSVPLTATSPRPITSGRATLGALVLALVLIGASGLAATVGSGATHQPTPGSAAADHAFAGAALLTRGRRTAGSFFRRWPAG